MTQLTNPNSGNGMASDTAISNFQQEESYYSDTTTPSVSASFWRDRSYRHEIPSGDIYGTHNQLIEVTRHSLTAKTAKILKSALDLISDAIDPELSKIEKSNCFDDWKQIIEEIARSAFDFDTSHNAIVGILMTSTSRKDLWDFPEDSLNIFRDATAQLRQRKILKADIDRITKRLMKVNVFKSWHPVYENDEMIESNLEHQFEDMKSYLLGNSEKSDTKD